MNDTTATIVILISMAVAVFVAWRLLKEK